MRAAIGKLARKDFDAELLSDPHLRNLQQHIAEKLKSGTDVLHAPEEPEAAEAESNVIDLMQVLKARLQGCGPQAAKPEPASKRGKPRGR